MRLAIALLAVAAVLRGLVWASALPPWQGPDEASHYAYVERLAQGQLPRGQQNRLSEAAAVSGGATAIYAFGGRTLDRPFTARTRAALPREDGNLSSDGSGALGANAYPPLYYAIELAFYAAPGVDRATERLYAARVGSALLAAVIVFATFGLVWQLCAEGRLALLAAALATSPPMLTQASAILNPDIGLTAATTALAYACVRLRRRGATAVGVAIVVVAALAVALAKPIGTAFAVVELAALLGWPWVLERPRRNSAVAAVAVAGGLAAIVGVAGDQFNLAAVRQHGILPSARFFLTYLWNFYFPPVLGLARDYVPGPLTSPLPVWAVWVKSGVGWFGYLNLTLPLWAYQLAAGSVVAALGAATGVLAKEARHVTPAVRGWIVVRGVVPLAATIAGFALALHLAEAASILTNGARIMQGRYLLPAWPLFAALLALPFALGRVRAGCVVLGALCLVWLFLSLVSLDAILRYYAT